MRCLGGFISIAWRNHSRNSIGMERLAKVTNDNKGFMFKNKKILFANCKYVF